MSQAWLESFGACQKAMESIDSYCLKRIPASVQAEQAGAFSRPFGTWCFRFNAFPGLKAWAIFVCPSGTGQYEIRSRTNQKERRLTARLAGKPNHFKTVRAGRNPFRVVDNQRLKPRVASQARQPWALRRNPFGILGSRWV